MERRQSDSLIAEIGVVRTLSACVEPCNTIRFPHDRLITRLTEDTSRAKFPNKEGPLARLEE